MKRLQKNEMAYDAAGQVGSHEAQQLEWLQDFAQRSVSEPEIILRTENQLLYFCRDWHFRRYAERPSAMSTIGFSGPMPLADLQEIAQRCLDYLRGKRSRAQGLPLYFNAQPIRFGLWWDPPRRPLALTEGQTAAAHFIAAVVSLIEAVGDKLRRCQGPDCERLFVAGRPKALYCSKRCQNRKMDERRRLSVDVKAQRSTQRRKQRQEKQKRQRAQHAGIAVVRVGTQQRPRAKTRDK